MARRDEKTVGPGSQKSSSLSSFGNLENPENVLETEQEKLLIADLIIANTGEVRTVCQARRGGAPQPSFT